MARQPRLTLPGHGHRIVQPVVDGVLLVHDDTDRLTLLEALQSAASAHGVDVWAYAILPGALHLLACPGAPHALARAMQALGRRYVTVHNRRHRRQGALWASRFRSAPVEPGEHVLTAMHDVDSLDAAASGWSSASHHLGRRREPLLTDPPELWRLGNTPFEREAAWAGRLAGRLSAADDARLTAALRSGRVFGSPGFAEQVAQALGRSAAPRPVGRPRKTVR